ncbi:MAG: heavy metal-binding domain-containing protein, partial [Candidatus Krumholzibacteria bacterium]|nr:heavy metal-binding domain-containing protein [Candidatus Krumholzibacteria bacterium]
MIVTTTEQIPGMRVTEVLDLVQGSSIRARH